MLGIFRVGNYFKQFTPSLAERESQRTVTVLCWFVIVVILCSTMHGPLWLWAPSAHKTYVSCAPYHCFSCTSIVLPKARLFLDTREKILNQQLYVKKKIQKIECSFYDMPFYLVFLWYAMLLRCFLIWFSLFLFFLHCKVWGPFFGFGLCYRIRHLPNWHKSIKKALASRDLSIKGFTG